MKWYWWVWVRLTRDEWTVRHPLLRRAAWQLVWTWTAGMAAILLVLVLYPSLR